MPTYSASNAEGYLLLKLQGVEGCFTSTNKAETATIIDQLSLECVSLSPPDFDKAQNSEQDIWLVLHVGTLEMVITPMQVVKHSRSTRTFVIESNGGQNALKLKFRNPQSLSEEEDLETFEVVLMQYAVVEEFEDLPPDYSPCPGGDPAFLKRPVPPPPVSPSLNIKLKVPPPLPPRPLLRGTLEIETGVDAKGKLVLVDEDDGEIIGTLGEEFRINADSNLAAKGHENDPVMVDLQSSENDQLAEVYIRAIPLEEQDYLMKTTTFISRGIVLATAALNSGISSATSFYINRSTPSSRPLVFSEKTRGRAKRIHKVSGKAVEVTAKTTGLIHAALDQAVRYASKGKSKEKSKTPGTTHIGNLGSSSPALSAESWGEISDEHFLQRSDTRSPAVPYMAPGIIESPPPRPHRLNKLLLSTDLLLTTLENSGKHLVEHSSLKLSEALDHKYGKDAGDASLLAGKTIHNVGLVYLDVRGVGRRALIKKAGKSFLRAKLGNRDVIFGVDEHGQVADS